MNCAALHACYDIQGSMLLDLTGLLWKELWVSRCLQSGHGMRFMIPVCVQGQLFEPVIPQGVEIWFDSFCCFGK